MAIDASIYQNVGRGVRSVADYDREAVDLENAKTTGQANKLSLLLNQQKADEYTRGVSEQNQLRGLLAGATTNEERIRRARASGLSSGFALADTIEKGDLDRQKTGAAVQKDTAEANAKTYDLGRKRYENRVGAVTRFTNVDDAKQWLADGVVAGDIPMAEATKMIGNIPADPAGFQKWQQDTLLSLADAGKQAGFVRPDANARLQANTSTANNAATNARAASEGAANRAVTMRGQDVNLSGQQLRADLAEEKLRLSQQGGAASDPSTTPVLGVPVPKVYPWSNQTLEKDANKVKASEARAGAKEIEKDTDNATQESQTAQRAARFLELNKKVSTGGVTDKFALGRMAQSMGNDYAEMEAITAELAPKMRVPGSGASSDYDTKQFERATVGVDKPRGANENIANALIARAQQAQDYADYRATYMEQNGTLTGAARHWKKYADANPIFEPKAKPGTFTLNKGRAPWRDYFKSQLGGGAGGAAAAPAPAAAPPAGAAPAPKFLGFEGE